MWLLIGLLLGLLLILSIRIIRWYSFIRRISKACYLYDKEYTYKNNDAMIEKLTTYKYYKNCEWSAYKRLFFNGPNPLGYLFSFEKLDIYNIYNKDVVDSIYGKTV